MKRIMTLLVGLSLLSTYAENQVATRAYVDKKVGELNTVVTNLETSASNTLTQIDSYINEHSGWMTGSNVVKNLSLRPDQTNSVSFHKNGYDENNSIQIGKDAVAGISQEYVDNCTSGTLRNVSVAIGARASAFNTTGKSQSIAVGYCAKADGSNAIAIGGGARHLDEETDITGNNAFASGSTTIAVGYSAKALADSAIAIGSGNSSTKVHTQATGKGAIAIGPTARADAAGAVQLGSGQNTEANTLKFQNVTVVKDGKVQGSFESKDLDPKQIDTSVVGEEVDVYPHVVNTVNPSAQVPVGMELGLNPKGSRNYEVFLPNNAKLRHGLPVILENELPAGTSVIYKNGQTFDQLPIMVKVTEPMSGVVIIDGQYLPDGYTDWAPVITNVNLKYDAVNKKFITPSGMKSVEGYNLHSATNIVVTWTDENTDEAKHIVDKGAESSIPGSLYPYFYLNEFSVDSIMTDMPFSIKVSTRLGSFTWSTNSVPTL